MSETTTQNPLVQRILIAFVMLMISVPGFVGVFHLVEERPVEGAWITPSPPVLSADGIFSGTFQNEYELWMNEKVGFHYSFIRFRNQLWYTLFKTNVMPDAVIGSDDYLYLKGYIAAYMGTDYVGSEAVSTMTDKLKALQDTLAKNDVTLIIVLAPGKASTYPEFIPDRFGPRQPVTNHSAMRSSFDAAGINLIDFNSYFAERRESAPYPIYSNTSVHWNNYAALEAMDSLIKYIEAKRNIDMPSVVFEGEEWSDVPREFDNDVGAGLNLIFPVKTCSMAYPKFHFENPEGKTKISMMTVADSYIRMMMSLGMVENLTTDHDYWYYNQGIEHSDGRPKSSTLDEDIAASTLKHDVVMILATDLNYAGFSWGYIHDAHRAIVQKQPIPPRERRVRQLENDIRMSKKWLFQVQQKAAAKKISLDSMIHLDALFEAEKESGMQNK